MNAHNIYLNNTDKRIGIMYKLSCRCYLVFLLMVMSSVSWAGQDNFLGEWWSNEGGVTFFFANGDEGNVTSLTISRIEGGPMGNRKSAVVPNRNKSEIVIGTIGVFDSGKTFLTCAITAVQYKAGLADKPYSIDELDDSPEEKEIGITMYPSIVKYSTKNANYLHYDCPGNKDYLSEFSKVAGKMKGAIFVIPAKSYDWDSDWKMEAERIIKIAQKEKLKRIVVFLNKCDLVNDVQELDKREAEIRSIIERYGYSKTTPVLRGSALGALNGISKWEKGVKELLDVCDTWIAGNSSE